MSSETFQSFPETLSIGPKVQNNFYNSPNAICLFYLSDICTTGTKAWWENAGISALVKSVGPNSISNPGIYLVNIF